MSIVAHRLPHDAAVVARGALLAPSLRRCIVGGHSAVPEAMLRFVVGPDDRVVPDVARRLPGKGMWTDATLAAVSAAVARNLFARAARRAVRSDPDLPQLVEQLLLERVIDGIGLARRAGRAVAGMAKVEESLRRGRVGLILLAGDAGSDGRKRLERVPLLPFADAGILGGIFGRDAATYVAIEDEIPGKGFASRIAAAVTRWDRYRGASMPQANN